ncbi:MAG: adenylosuccinate lyase, partial [Candidatus Thermoplasmatota archaeon]|nr:adenylosuccinate lyase [Candidatus Thermoplasmatota archaeon]
MTVCPLDFRYGTKEMREIFSDEGKLRRMLMVEAALAEAQAQVGMVSPETASAISEAALSGRVTPQRVDEIEAETCHDVMSV